MLTGPKNVKHGMLTFRAGLANLHLKEPTLRLLCTAFIVAVMGVLAFVYIVMHHAYALRIQSPHGAVELQPAGPSLPSVMTPATKILKTFDTTKSLVLLRWHPSPNDSGTLHISKSSTLSR